MPNLYLPEELELTRFLRKGERYIFGHELCGRAPGLRVVTGAEQFQFLWDNRDKIPENWKGVRGLLVPDSVAGVVHVLFWGGIFECWCHRERNLYGRFGGGSRVLVPRELS